MPLLVTCNYVAMMSLIFCIGWKLRDAERLESAGKCLAVWNTNMLICEQWLKGKCFFHSTPPANVYLHRVETEWKTDRPTDWLSGRLTQPWRTCRILAAWQADRPAPGPWVEREEEEEEKINKRRKKRNDKPVCGERQWWVSFQIRCPPFGKKKWQLLSQNDW